MQKTAVFLLIVAFIIIFPVAKENATEQVSENIAQKYANEMPREWGEVVTGVNTRLATEDKFIAFTFDACGTSELSKGYDKELIQYLIQENIPATLFISGLWIDANRDIFRDLAQQPVFEIENHGLRHRPASVSGRTAYGLLGTSNTGELIDEVQGNAKKIADFTGVQPRYYRSGTNYYDEVAVKITMELGYNVVGYSVLGDAGATYSREKVRDVLINVSPGSIILLHMNHPESQTAEGVMDAIPILREKGYRFVKLAEIELL